MTNYQKVLDFNTKFGATIHSTPVPDIFDSNPFLVKLKMDLIREEFGELKVAVSNKDYIETIDALADLLYVIYGMATGIGFDMDITFGTIYLSNLSKVSLVKNTSQFTNFQKVVYFNNKIGTTVNTTPVVDIFDKDPYCVSSKMYDIQKNMLELEDNVSDKNYIGTIYSLTNLLHSIYSMGAYIGTDMDKAFDLVHESNMSKLCSSESEAIDTVNWYYDEFRQNKLPYDSPNFRKSNDGKYWIVYNESSGKILKSINYNVVDLSKLL